MKPLQLNKALSYGHSSLQHPSSLPMTEEAFRETRYHWQSPLAASDWLLDRDPCPHSGVGALCSSGPHPKELLPMQSWELPLHTSGNVFCSSVEGRRCFWMVFLLEVAVIHWQTEQSPVLLPLSKVSPGEYSQRLRGWEHLCPFFCFSRIWESCNSECYLDVGTCTAHRFTAVTGLSFLPRLSLSPGLALTKNSCS